MRRSSAVCGLVALLATRAAAQDAGVAPLPSWTAACTTRLERLSSELVAEGIHLGDLEVHAAPGFMSGGFVYVSSGDGRVYAMIEDWTTGLSADAPWSPMGFGECPDEREMRMRWVVREVRNYATGRQGQMQARGVRHARALRRILASALDACAAM